MDKEVVRHPCRIIRVIDGDTVSALIYTGLGQCRIHVVRIKGVNAPESYGPERERGLIIKGKVKDWTKDKQKGKELFPLILETTDTIRGHDRYGRIVGDIMDKQNNSLSAFILSCVNDLERQ